MSNASKVCSVENCDRAMIHRATGYCRSHYQRFTRNPNADMSIPLQRLIDLTGKQFGKLTVTGRGEGPTPRPYWTCVCECGGAVTVSGDNLRRGKATSCGCRVAEKNAELRMTHGHTVNDGRTPEYGSWSGMNKRCHNPNNRAYPDYGGRGIQVCPEWRESFEAFYAHIGPKPGPGYSVDRINNDGNYEPGNVRWATAKEQANNRRNSKRAA